VTFIGYIDYTTESNPRPFYVGIGVEKRTRVLYRNKKHTNVHRKHGLDRRVLVGFRDWEAACEWEKSTILELQTFHHAHPAGIGCNFTTGGDGFVGGRHTEENRKAIRERMLGKRYSLGRKQTPEERRRRSESLKGKIVSDETRRKLSIAMTNNPKRKGPRGPLSKETREKIRQANMGNKSALGAVRSTETRELMSKAAKSRPRQPLSEEHRQKLSLALQNYWASKGS